MARGSWSGIPVPPETQWATARVVRQSTEQKAFVLDVLVSSDGDLYGRPVVLLLARPDTLWFDAAVEHVLDGWADSSLAVRFAVKRGRRGPVAILEPEGGDTSVRLDLLAVA